MIMLKVFITILFLSTSISSCSIYNFFAPDFTKKECEYIRKKLPKIQRGMTKEKVFTLINTEIKSKVYPHSGLFPEHKTQWEIWILCVDLDSCITANSGSKQCYKWHMIAFDVETNKVVKVFSDDPERIGFT